MPLGPRRKNRKSDAKTLGALDLGAFLAPEPQAEALGIGLSAA
jgi:hypothetical protein